MRNATCIETGCTLPETKQSIGCQLCDFHFEIAGAENSLADGHMTEDQFNAFVQDQEGARMREVERRAKPKSTRRVEHTSTVESPVQRVWEICFENAELSRAEIIALCLEAGVTRNTANTQYQQFRKALLG